MKKLFLLLSILVTGSLTARSQLYITENGNLIKVTKTLALNKNGAYSTIFVRDTIGQGDFGDLPSDILKTAAEKGYAEYTDTIVQDPNPLLGIFFKNLTQRTKIITRDADSDYFEVDKQFIPVDKKQWNNSSLVGTFLGTIFLFVVLVNFRSKDILKRDKEIS